jgi:hypothetical protein
MAANSPATHLGKDCSNNRHILCNSGELSEKLFAIPTLVTFHIPTMYFGENTKEQIMFALALRLFKNILVAMEPPFKLLTSLSAQTILSASMHADPIPIH